MRCLTLPLVLLCTQFSGGLVAHEFPDRFDFGPALSPVAANYTAVTPDKIYTAEQGWGFTTPPKDAELLDKSATVIDPLRSQSWRVIEGMIALDDRTRDYVAGTTFSFRVDIPDGDYEIVALLGNRRGLHHQRIVADGRVVADNISAYTYHYALRGQRDDRSIGGIFRVHFRVAVSNGALNLTFCGNPEGTAQSHRIQNPAGGPPLTFESEAAFEATSLMALKLWPAEESRLNYDASRLSTDAAASLILQEAVAAFNRGDLQSTKRLANQVEDTIDQAYLWMALAGHPGIDGDEESSAINRAMEILARNPACPRASDLLEQVDLFQQAVSLFHDRNTGNTEIRMIGNLHKSHSIWRQFDPQHPFHYKGLLYSGRAFKGMVPFSFTPKSELGMDLFRQVETVFPQNKYVRLYLQDEWSPSHWQFNEYAAPTGTPPWAEAMRRVYCQTIDFGRWWAIHRQQENGSLGGGWNDDVELMPIFALTWLASPDAAPELGEMLRRFTEGLWNSENLDRRQAFSAELFDAEHAAEDQGNSLPYLTAMFYGNPRYLQWNIATLQHFRNFLTAVNANGHRHFRSHHFGATRYALDLDPNRANEGVEAAICYRSFGPAPWLAWYNSNPIAIQLIVEHADGWLAAAMSQEKRKPRGIIPAQMSFHDEVGGPAQDWRGEPGLGGGGSWPAYTMYLENLLLNAYRFTGDDKYLSPFVATFEWLNQFKDEGGSFALLDSAPDGSEKWVYNTVVGSRLYTDAFFAIREMTGDTRFDAYIQQCGSPYLQYRLTGDRGIVVDELSALSNRLRQRWPHMTTDAVMTDRIGYSPQMASYLMGAPVQQCFLGFPNQAVTYLNTMRDFAAIVEHANETELKLSYYSFWDSARTIQLRPWRLAAGARYRVRVLDQQGSEISAGDWNLQERGQPLPVQVPSHQEVTIDIRQLSAEHALETELPDLAISPNGLLWNVETDLLEATITNIGNRDCTDIELAFYHQRGKERTLLERAVISRIGAPNNLHIDQVSVGTWNHRNPLREGDDVVVVIDPDQKLKEITRSNNQANFRLYLTDDQRERMLAKRLTTPDRRGLLPVASVDPLSAQRPQVRYLKDIQYAAQLPISQRLDAFLVHSQQPSPAVIEFHGGGWRRGEKGDLDQYGELLRFLIDQGVSVISVDYRLTPTATWPAQGEDARLAINYVLDHAAEWNIDPQRIALLGGSAGGQLALWAGLQPESRVACIVDLWGPTDLAIIPSSMPRGDAIAALFGCTLQDLASPTSVLAESIRNASPVNFVNQTSPPVFIVHDGPADATDPADPRFSGDKLGPHSAAFGLILADRLQAAGVPHRLLISPQASLEFQSSAWQFLQQHLKIAP